MGHLERQELLDLIKQLKYEVELLRSENERLRLENESLRNRLDGSGKPEKPGWVKPNKNVKEDKLKAHRKDGFVRCLDVPTNIINHSVDRCSCGECLSGGWIHRSRQVIDIPMMNIVVTEHVLIARKCGICGKVNIPSLADSGLYVGKSRFGINLMSLICNLAISCRVPIRTIKKILSGLYKLNISTGEIVRIIQKVSEVGEENYDKLLDDVRGSPVVHGDETGWREDGANGYIWSFSTPDVRYYLYDKSRGSRIVTKALGDDFTGTLVSDFYGGYNIYDGPKQRCWVHFLRDLNKLEANNAEDKLVLRWIGLIRSIYKKAKKSTEYNLTQSKRNKLRQDYEKVMLRLAEPYLKQSDSALNVLAKRIDRFVDEMFVFVEYPIVPSENNAAERAIRPAVVARKVSGGSRSKKGSKTKMILLSLFETWTLQKLNTFKMCSQMLANSNI